MTGGAVLLVESGAVVGCEGDRGEKHQERTHVRAVYYGGGRGQVANSWRY
jgi:hypothetical protein